MRLLVGTYTDIATGNSSSEGVYLYDLNPTSLQGTCLSCARAINPSFVAVCAGNAYTLSECGTHSFLHSIAIDGDELRLISSIKSPGDDPCHIIAHQGVIATANYTNGSISTVAINPDGTLGNVVQHLQLDEHGASPRQLAAHIHNLAIAPCGTIVAASNLGGDCVYLLKINPDHSLTTIDTAFTPPESGPRHLVWNNDGTRLYLITELTEQVITLAVSNGKLHIIDAVTAARTVHPGGGDIHLHPSGRWLYASVRNMDDGIARYELDHDGKPINREFYPTGKHPRNFAITPCGTLLLCACRDKDAIELYRIDPTTGSLTYLPSHDIPIDKPVCITII